MKFWIRFFFLSVFFASAAAGAGDPNEILEQETEGVRKLVGEVNGSVRSKNPYSSPEGLFILEGCYGNKKGEEFENSLVNVKALYYSEIFKRNTNKITRVHYLFKKPVSLAAAQDLVADFAPFLRGRNSTQESAIIPFEKVGECTPKFGGVEKRYTRDYFIEFYYSQTGSKMVGEARMWNANYNN